MKITKYVEFGQEVEIDVSAEDILMSIFCVDDESTESVVRSALNNCAVCAVVFSGVSDERIAAMSETLRHGIREFLLTQAERYAEKT